MCVCEDYREKAFRLDTATEASIHRTRFHANLTAIISANIEIINVADFKVPALLVETAGCPWLS